MLYQAGEFLSSGTLVPELLQRAADRSPGKTAIDFYGKKISYKQLFDLAVKTAVGLKKIGVGPSVNVGLHLPNTPHFVILFFGVLLAGGRVVTISPNASLRELEFQIKNAELRIVATFKAGEAYAKLLGLLEQGTLHDIVACDRDAFFTPSSPSMFEWDSESRKETGAPVVDFNELVTAASGHWVASPRPSEDEVAVLLYTGGTTGEPKGAMLTHRNFIEAMKAWSHGHNPDAAHPNDISLIVMPLYHSMGLIVGMLLSIFDEISIVLHLKFEAATVLATIDEKKITRMVCVPTVYSALVDHPRVDQFTLSSLRICVAGGAPVPIELRDRFKRATGVILQVGYGLTETACVGTLEPPEGAPAPGTIGNPKLGSLIEVFDLVTGNERLPIGQCGEICFSGPALMKGYWKNAGATESAIRNGRFYTGDIGFIDDQGYITLVDRKKDMIICGGFNVFSRNIEAAMYENPSVAEVLVIGLPDENLGQIVKAYVAYSAGCKALTYQEWIEFLDDKLNVFEMPIEIETRMELPRTAVGKLSKKDLLIQEGI